MNKPTKGGTMEGVLFLASCALLILSGYLYLKREDNDFVRLRKELTSLSSVVLDIESKIAHLPKDKQLSDNKLSSLTDAFGSLEERVSSVEVQIIEQSRTPQVMNVVIKEPIKVLTKQVVSKPKTLPGLTPQLKQQMNQLSQ